MFIHMYIVYTHPLFVASHSSWWNDQGLQDKTHVTWPCCVYTYIYMGISENWIKGWFALLPWPWWPIEIFPEVTVRYCKWPSENYDSSNKTLIYIYIYTVNIYIYIYNWMMITYDQYHMGFPFIPIHHCDTWICDMCFALFILNHPIGTRRSPVVFVDLEAPWILYYHNCHTSQLLELYI